MRYLQRLLNMANYPRTIYATLLASYGAFVLMLGIFIYDHQYRYDSEAQTEVVPVYWDASEPLRQEYDFSNTAEKLEDISKRGDTATVALGFKLPDGEGDAACAFPDWYDRNSSQPAKDKQLFQYLAKAVNFFEQNPAVVAWQIEHNAYIESEDCPEYDRNLLDAEIAVVEGVDDTDKEIIVDRGPATLSDFKDWFRRLVN